MYKKYHIIAKLFNKMFLVIILFYKVMIALIIALNISS